MVLPGRETVQRARPARRRPDRAVPLRGLSLSTRPPRTSSRGRGRASSSPGSASCTAAAVGRRRGVAQAGPHAVGRRAGHVQREDRRGNRAACEGFGVAERAPRNRVPGSSGWRSIRSGKDVTCRRLSTQQHRAPHLPQDNRFSRRAPSTRRSFSCAQIAARATGGRRQQRRPGRAILHESQRDGDDRRRRAQELRHDLFQDAGDQRLLLRRR